MSAVTTTGERARAGGIAALTLPPVGFALIGLFLLARESRAGASSRTVPTPPPR